MRNENLTLEIKVKETAKILGMRKKELIKSALIFYLDNLKPYLDLKKESKLWDRASEEAFLNFEKLL